MSAGSLYISGQQLPALPSTIDQQVVQQLLAQLSAGSEQQRIVAAHTLSHLLETEEAKYRALVGDPHANPNLRSHYAIGKVLSVLKDDEDAYDAVVDHWIAARTASLEQQVAGLRLLHACLDCWQFQYPLTEESLVEKLGLWALTGITAQQGQPQQGQQQQDQQQQQGQKPQPPAVLGDSDPAGLTAFLEEARATYALGLLGIALANEEYADEAVQTQLIPAACRYFQRAVLAPHQLTAAQRLSMTQQQHQHAQQDQHQHQQQEQQQQQQDQEPGGGQASTSQQQQQQQKSGASWDRHRAPTKSALKAAGATAADAAGGGGRGTAASGLHSEDATMQQLDSPGSAADKQQQDGQQQQQQVAGNALCGNAYLALAAASADGLASQEVLQLRLRKLLGVMRVLTCTGEYVEALGPFLAHQGVESCCLLLQAWRNDGVLLNEALQVVCSLLAHRRFGELLVQHGGVQLLLALPRNSHTNMGLSLTLFGLASLPLAFERTCALPAPVPAQMVQAGLALLAVANDAARKNAALFFDAAVHYPVLLECFDSNDGLHRLLYPLQHVVQLLQAGGPAELRAERQVAYHASRALLQYARAHLVIHLTALQRRLRDGQAPSAAPQPHKPINTSAAAVEELISAVSTDAKLAEAFVRTRWPLLERLDQHRLVPLLLDLVRVLPGEERYFSDITLYGLEVLQLVTLSPLPRRAIVAASSGSSGSSSGRGGQAGSSRSGMATLLHAASTGNTQPFYGLADPEVIATALHVIVHCVTAPPSLAYLLPPPGSAAGGGGGAGGTASGGVVDKNIEAHQTPQGADAPSSAELAAPPALELGPSAVSAGRPPSLGDALEAGYAAARQAVRSSNGIRVLLMLLQSRQHLAPAAADRVRALACMAVLGLARDASIRHILTKLQVGKLLAELVREPLGPGAAGGSSSRREVNAGSEAGASGNTGALWQERFHKAALELIAITTSSGAGGGGRAETRLAAAAATDAAAPALLKIERAAIAASTPISYQPQELLLLIYEHLKASGLHSAAASLAREAGLASGNKPAAAAALAAAAAAAAVGWQQQQPGGGAGAASPLSAGVPSAVVPGTPSAAAASAAVAAAAAAAAGGGSSAVQQLAAADAAAAAVAAASAAAAAGFVTPAMGLKSSSAGGTLGELAAGGGAGGAGSSSSALGSRDRRRTLSLGPNLLQHLNRESTGSDSDQQQQQQQQHVKLSAQGGGGRSAAGGNGGNGSRLLSQLNGAAGLRGASPPLPAGTAGAGAAAHTGAAVVGSKRRASAGESGAAAAGGDLDVPPSKRQATGQQPLAGAAAGKVGSSSSTGDGTAAAAGAAAATPAAGAVARAAAAGGGGPAAKQASSPVHSSRHRNSLVGSRAAALLGSRSASDAEYVLSLQQQQQHLQQGLESVFHSQNPPATPAAGLIQGSGVPSTAGYKQHGARSPYLGPAAAAAAAAAGAANGPVHLSTPSPGPWFGPSAETPLPPAATPMVPLPPPGSSSAVAAAAAAAGGSSSSAGGAQTPGGAAAAAAAAAGVNPLLTNLPSSTKWGSGKGGASGLQRRLSGGAEAVIPHRLTSIAEAAPEPKPLPLHVQVAAREVMTGPPVNSRLGAIVTAYLRQQHRAACLTAAQPVSVVPPVSLLKPYSLPVATRPLNAPANVTLRLARQEVWGGFGGRGGAAATRRLVWSRFRLTNTLRDDGPLLTACCFLRGFETLVAGTASGELKLHDAYNGDTVELVDAHSAPVNLLQAAPNPGGAAGDQLLLSSSRSEVLLWRADGFDAGPLFSWPGMARGRFNSTGTQLVGVAVGSSPRQARVYDTATGDVIATLDEAAAAAAAAAAASVGAGSSSAAGGSNGAAAAAGGGELVRGSASACFSPSGELVLWGATLWDPRVPAPLHTFDQLSSNSGGAGGVFHPNGGEIILNSEVWDLRTRKLLRSVPLLDGTSITFSSGGDVLAAWLRRPADDSMAALLQPKRRRHTLATSFAILDARTYSEIANVQVERALLDLCLDPSDSFLAAVAVDMGSSLSEGSVSSSVRLYEVGRQRPAEDDDDESDGGGEDEEDEESDESDGDGDDGDDGAMLQALLGRDQDGGGGDDDAAMGGQGEEGLGAAYDGLDGGSDLDEGASDLDEEAVNALREEFADLYEEALAAGIDPDEISIDEDEFEYGDEGSEGGGAEDEEELMAALEGDVSSSSYETDDEA